jgi:hypothetical protein
MADQVQRAHFTKKSSKTRRNPAFAETPAALDALFSSFIDAFWEKSRFGFGLWVFALLVRLHVRRLVHRAAGTPVASSGGQQKGECGKAESEQKG